MTQSAAIRSMHRPEGTLAERPCAAALISVALAALAVGLGVGLRNWRIGAGLGAGSVLVAALGCSSPRRVVQDVGIALEIVVGDIGAQHDVQVICFVADRTLRVTGTDQNQSQQILDAAGDEPFESPNSGVVSIEDGPRVFCTRAGRLAAHGVQLLVHMVGPEPKQRQRLREAYLMGLNMGAVEAGPVQSVAISLITRPDMDAAYSATQLVAAIRSERRDQYERIRIVAANAEQQRAVQQALGREG
jgi:hypothetical protein